MATKPLCVFGSIIGNSVDQAFLDQINTVNPTTFAVALRHFYCW